MSVCLNPKSEIPIPKSSSMSTPRINWVNEQDATGDLEELYRKWFEHNPGRTEIPHILKCFSQRPDFLRDVMEFSYRVHFSDGHLTRPVHGTTATSTSPLPQCPSPNGS